MIALKEVLNIRFLITSLLIAGFLFCSPSAQAQRGCATVDYQKILQQKYPNLDTEDQFENWLSKRISENKKKFYQRGEATVFTLPVVVHVIHLGEDVGDGLNIPDNQIFSQIDVLNEDFRRLNDDQVNTPSDFAPVAADIEINFALAQRDPEGLPTNGIVRINGNKSVWELADNYALKSLSSWNTEDYLNIWVTNLGSDYLGYAQFPISTLAGLEGASNNAFTDGVVIDYRAFGSKIKDPNANVINSFDRGRTATHEIGHFFGLRHIWGDGGCSQDDYCDDTPKASTDNGNYNSCNYPGPNTCTDEPIDFPDMFQNYMDYTDDVCMNLFTEDQKTRIRTVLENSPRRLSLTESKGAMPPVVVSNDLGIRNIINPSMTACGDSYAPQIEVRNYGSNVINQVSVNFYEDDVLVETISSNVTLGHLDITTLDFGNQSISVTGSKKLTFEVTQVNGAADNNADNNIKETDIEFPETAVGPIRLDFNELPEQWTINNIDQVFTWEIKSADNGEPGNSALCVEFYNYENEGELDLFSSPVIDFSTKTTAQLSFEVAYAKYPNIDNEGLLITIGPNCANALTQADTLYYKVGNELSTVNSTSGFFTPSSIAHWRKETIDLASYIGEEALQINFIAKNGYGNNLYIDNLVIDDVSNKIIAPSPLSCNPNQELLLEVVNSGLSAINSFDVNYTLDNGPVQSETFNLVSPLEPGFSTQVSKSLNNLDNGEHFIELTIDLPNTSDVVNLSHNFFIDTATDFLPIKEAFENFETSDWIIVNHDNLVTWELQSTDENNYLTIDNTVYESKDADDWLISPSIDFTVATQATLTFDYAYSSVGGNEDGLTLYISTDCGESYFRTGFNKFGENLTTGDFFNAPSLENWQTETIDLSQFITNDEVRLAFVSTNKNGNPIYLDNIQVYVTDVYQNIDEVIFPNPTIDGRFSIVFDLPQKEFVRLYLYDAAGHLLSTTPVQNTLNQRYEFDISHQPHGIYIVRAVGESFTLSRRVMKSD
ncbi:T9SS-dependent choice-of-anchor J family protein [Fulvivirga lutimaris]|uniref:T9SS-dependent choice-of-anchor J family protein n=1 Tax=Fulvivirga lutimaris TaxID=1819566 RepID=UPI0012BD1092|nr:choice-of-anchor J domain-containing protein [Fulvivirga lutimaris]MTI39662.1 T9SS type A sorting domain-containing protein [Fulvivirga lutimaris]